MDSFCEDINHYLRRYKYKKDNGYVSYYRGCFYSGGISKYNLQLRLIKPDGPWKTHTLVIARIKFKERRRGEGSSLLYFLCSIAKKYGIKHIGIEELNEYSEGFAEKLGFVKIKRNNAHRCWESSVKNLQTILEKRRVNGKLIRRRKKGEKQKIKLIEKEIHEKAISYLRRLLTIDNC